MAGIIAIFCDRKNLTGELGQSLSPGRVSLDLAFDANADRRCAAVVGEMEMEMELKADHGGGDDDLILFVTKL